MLKLLDGHEAWKIHCCVSGVFEWHMEDNQTLESLERTCKQHRKYTKSKALELWGYEGYV